MYKLILFNVTESIFPPVFGHRLQTQIAKLGERVIMDVEITGLPEPTVTWYKDDLPLNEASVSQHKVQKMGNCYKLIIEKGLQSYPYYFHFCPSLCLIFKAWNLVEQACSKL